MDGGAGCRVDFCLGGHLLGLIRKASGTVRSRAHVLPVVMGLTLYVLTCATHAAPEGVRKAIISTNIAVGYSEARAACHAYAYLQLRLKYTLWLCSQVLGWTGHSKDCTAPPWCSLECQDCKFTV
jgi:hypothetical protein